MGSEDQAQTETGVDANALRNNVAPGTTKGMKIAAIHKDAARGLVVVSAWVSDTDIDADECVLEQSNAKPAKGEDAPKLVYPSKGEIWNFTRPADGGMLVISPMNTEGAQEHRDSANGTANND